MTVKTELLNFLTGALLVASGVLNLWQHDFVVGMNWIIFGAMYLVMDDYLQNEKLSTSLEKLTDWSRKIFSWVGLAGSLILFAYYVNLFLNLKIV